MTTVGDRASVHEFLLSTHSYPERPNHVELRETHISWVYLTDRFVYKQKKPVNFEFLDFSTLERRKHYCEQEVMLNRRFSPDVYLGVVPVTCDAEGRYQLRKGRSPVEWLVKMLRLDESSTLENLILNEALTASHVKQLSSCLSKFYVGQAPAMLRSDDFVQTIRHHILANRNDLLIALPDEEPTIQFATKAQLRCLSLEADVFVQRVCDGRVVDGHGDLRPEHVYFRGSRPVIIDCIEFNQEYRTNDVVDELAFLSMECDRLGNETVAGPLFDSYLQLSGDHPQPFLALFYKCYRACVRAKVSAIRSAQQTGDEKRTSVGDARSYLHLAERYANELAPRLVIVVGGLMGTGKSTLSSALQEFLGGELLQTDIVRNELFARDSNSSYGNGKYSSKSRQRVYDAMIARIPSAFSRSPTVILDGTFSATAARRAVFKTASGLGAKVLHVQCQCPREEAVRRISSRLSQDNDASQARPELYAAQAAEYQPFPDGAELVEVNTLLAGPQQLEAVLTRVRRLDSQ